jgi:hypothetical protein
MGQNKNTLGISTSQTSAQRLVNIIFLICGKSQWCYGSPALTAGSILKGPIANKSKK